jgi:adhesin/invasin
VRARPILASRRALLGALIVAMACTEDHPIAPPAVAALVIFPDTATVTVGDSLVLQAVARDQNGHAFVGAPTAWTSRRPALATVSAMGLVKAVASGTDTITATAGTLSATARIAVVARPSLAFTRDSVGFAATANGPNPGADSVTVVNPGGGPLTGVALGTISYGAGASGWLGDTLRGTATPDILVLTAQTGTLAVGSYTATVPVTAAAATNSPHTLKVTFVVGVGAAASIAANGGSAQSATVTTAVAVAPSVIVRDQFNNPVPGTTISFAVRSGGGSVTGGSQQTNASGVATVGSWTLGTTAGPDTLTASSGGLSGSPVIFTATATAGPATKLVFTQQPTSAQAGVPITPAVQVVAQDAYGNTATSYATAIAVAIGTNPPGTGVLSGTTSVVPSGGAAAFGNLSIDKTGTGYTLVASSGSLVGAASSGFTISPSTTPAGSKSTLTASIGTITASSGTSTTVITVTVRDTFSNPIPGAAVAVGATGTGNAFSPAASGTTDGTGVFQASFSSTKAEAKTISAVANGSVAIVQTAAVTVNPAAISASQSSVVATTGTITACSTGCVAGSTAGTIMVTVRDAFNNPINGAAVTSAATGTGNTLAPTSGTSNGSGVFQTTFNSTTAQAKTISATAGGTAITQTAAVTVSAAAPANLAVNGGNNQVARVGTNVATAPSALATDGFGNAVSGASVTFGSLTGGGSVTGSPATTNGSGIATLGSWTLGAVAAAGDSARGMYTNTVTASATGTNSVQFADSGFYSLANDVMPIFATAPAGPCSSCHSAGFPPDFSAAANFYNSTVSKTGSCNTGSLRVAPGNWGASLLGLLMNAAGPAGCTTTVMPPGGVLPAATRRIISDWVNRSALNN